MAKLSLSDHELATFVLSNHEQSPTQYGHALTDHVVSEPPNHALTLFTSKNVKIFEREDTKLHIHISPLYFYYYFMHAHAFNHKFLFDFRIIFLRFIYGGSFKPPLKVYKGVVTLPHTNVNYKKAHFMDCKMIKYVNFYCKKIILTITKVLINYYYYTNFLKHYEV